MTDLLAESEVPVPVLLHAPMMRARRRRNEERQLRFERPVPAGGWDSRTPFRPAHEGYVPKSRLLLFEAAIAVANGLSAEDA